MNLFILFFATLALAFQNIHAASNLPSTQANQVKHDNQDDEDLNCDNPGDKDRPSRKTTITKEDKEEDNDDSDNEESDTSDVDNEEDTSDDLTYTNPAKHYDLTYPKTWVKNENIKGFDVFLADPNSLANVSVISQKLPANVTLKEYAEGNIKTLMESVPSIQVIKQGETTLSDLPAYWILYTRGDDKTKIMHFFTIDNGQAFLLTLGASQDSFDKFKDTFDDIVDNFNVETTEIEHTK